MYSHFGFNILVLHILLFYLSSSLKSFKLLYLIALHLNSRNILLLLLPWLIKIGQIHTRPRIV